MVHSLILVFGDGGRRVALGLQSKKLSQVEEKEEESKKRE